MGYARKNRLSWRRVGEQTVVVDPEAKRLYGLNSSAGVIWHALDGAKSPDEFASLFDTVDEATGLEMRRVVDEFLTKLDDEGLLDRAPSPSSLRDVSSGTSSLPRPPWSAPEVSWREEIQTFARGCAFHPGENVLCNMNPRS